MGTKHLMDIETLTRNIFVLRGQRVMLSRDLATLYSVEHRALIQAVKRNQRRFKFASRLNQEVFHHAHVLHRRRGGVGGDGRREV